MTRISCALLALIVLTFVFLPASGIAAEKAANPCSYLTPAEIQEAFGQPVKTGVPQIHPSPAAGANCNYTVGDFGSLNVLAKPLGASETPDRVKAEFVRQKMSPVDVPNLGDRSFFTSPGYGMIQLNTFKGSKYILFTILVSGLKEDALKTAAEKLMRLVLSRLK